jgi:TolB protein
MHREAILRYMKDRHQQCALEIYNIKTNNRQVLARFDHLIEAPNWARDGKTLIYNSQGLIYRFDIKELASEVIDTDFANLCNNDHVLSFDGKYLAISCNVEEDLKSRIFIVPAEGGIPRRVTTNGPSYLHGWSPDGALLTYCAERNGIYNVYAITAAGEDEKRLTFSRGLDDGPEYDPNGAIIWFCSTQSGLMQIWRMKADGSEQMQVSHAEMNCWFPHVSPDGRQIVYIAYYIGDLKPEEHLPDKRIQIRLMDRFGNHDRVLLELTGGQGTMNVNSWSPDGQSFAFVSYD